ncbi:2-dehydro-3-deoxygalactonokinase [Niabella drilacis]|uniref:2-dehydro-3-deoxygalactonokinase n=1 Tax=Niabella drilacis (strain DSM 25811 / CCM 8410 / CCUG 62505 / LMG 26954 / E90) TaxID=1285928 RepID=A0A1G6NDG3_NIADE|nr:2-dehydro-3-deoxygalactonokinase [Niabella drilacis]SDC65494.1 2-dehydro-3-deoxygalactonokinase [Niabella drilacis]
MDTFLSCDWGTSTFRLRLVGASDLVMQAAIQHQQGIARVAADWEQTGAAISRQVYYTTFLNAQVHVLEQQLGYSLAGVPLVLSGMASSSIGLMELPYKTLPFFTNGADLVLRAISNDRNPILLVSGACTSSDVMRGEETKIVGVADVLPVAEQELLLLLPGTHPKHVQVRGRRVTGFQTFMTGEVFSLLAEQSILAGSVIRNSDLGSAASREYFIRGVHLSRQHSFLHHVFGVRTNQLLKEIQPEQNYHYLSGLLIGEELKTLPPNQRVYLLGSTTHVQAYVLACEALGIRVSVLPDADQALVRGQQQLLQNYRASGAE